MSRIWLPVSLILACAAMTHVASAQTAANSANASAAAQSPLQVRALAATCANCHGTDGKAVSGSAVGSLVGLTQDYLSTQLRAFKTGQRPATVMHQLAKGYTDEQLDQLAAYFANQR